MNRGRALIAVGILVSGCGGGASAPPSLPSAPTPAPSPTVASSIPAGTVLTVRSGETDEPVSGASLVLGSQTVTTDSGGEVPLPEAVTPEATLDILAAGFLDRQTRLPSSSATRFTLWPRTSPTGIDETYTSTLVYTDAGESGGTPGAAALLRLRHSLQPLLLPSPEILNDPHALAAHEDAIHAVAVATAGQVVYTLVTERPATGGVIETRVDPQDAGCDEGTRAFTSLTARSFEIGSARIVFCSAEAARTATVIHELGHTFGLQHSPDRQELMHGFFSRNRNTTFSAREALTMRLMLQRRGGNRYPDNDRALSARGDRTVRIICR